MSKVNIADHIPETPESCEWDVIVIGSGMGGSTIGYELARLGRRVLFIEKGKFLHGQQGFKQVPPQACSEREARLINGRWPERIKGTTSFGEAEFYGPLGCGTGGSTILYGAQLERFSAADFTPAAHFPHIRDANLPEQWPLAYADLLPYYRKAEAHLRVCGSQDPLNPDPDAPLHAPPKLSERDQFVFSTMRESGLDPYRSHVGYHKLADCWECLDQCHRDCKSDAGTRSLLPAILEHGACILPDCEVIGLDADQRAVKIVHALRNGKKLQLKGKVIVLAAGAFMTPALLLRSRSTQWPDGLANGSGMVGRNLMLHASDFIMFDQAQELDARGPVKSISVNNFYFNEGQKLGTLQSLGLRPLAPFILGYLQYLQEKDPSWLRRRTAQMLPKMAEMASHRFRRSVAFGTIVEDLPYLQNRVILDANVTNGYRFEYNYSEDLRQRSKRFVQLVARSLSPKLSTHVVTGSRNNLNYGHVCGTCRFGQDPKTSVLDASNRAHELDNLYVVDASFFPSSGGTNPSLTIAANALRVGGIIHQQLS